MTRFAFQTELWGLTATQRRQGATAINAALDSEAVSDVTDRTVIQDFIGHHGEVELFAEANFASDASSQRVFSTARQWASTRAEDSPSGRHSYVRIRAVDADTRTILTRYAESPGWIEQDSTDEMVPQP